MGLSPMVAHLGVPTADPYSRPGEKVCYETGHFARVKATFGLYPYIELRPRFWGGGISLEIRMGSYLQW